MNLPLPLAIVAALAVSVPAQAQELTPRQTPRPVRHLAGQEEQRLCRARAGGCVGTDPRTSYRRQAGVRGGYVARLGIRLTGDRVEFHDAVISYRDGRARLRRVTLTGFIA